MPWKRINHRILSLMARQRKPYGTAKRIINLERIPHDDFNAVKQRLDAIATEKQ
jgi:hypothetical protein